MRTKYVSGLNQHTPVANVLRGKSDQTKMNKEQRWSLEAYQAALKTERNKETSM
jgi:hypothetical protein